MPSSFIQTILSASESHRIMPYGSWAVPPVGNFLLHDHPALKIFIELLCLLSLCRSAFISACTKDYTAGWWIWQDGFFIPYIAFTLIFLFNPFFCKIFLYFFTSFFGTLTTAFLLIPLNASAPIELSFSFSVLMMIVLILLQP